MITAERMVLDDKNRGFEYPRHVFAYEFAAALAEGKDVLDMGCGEGYGAALMAGRAANSAGVDVSAEAVRNASAAHPVKNLRFICADATATGLPAASFDVVCSFQVIEHFSDPAPLLAEMARLLKPGGLAVISTPNRDVSGSVFNPYHPVEYDRAGLEGILRPYFREVQLHGVIGNELTMNEMRAFKKKASLLMRLDIFGIRKLAHLAPVRKLYDIAVVLTRLATKSKDTDYSFTVDKLTPEKGIDFIAVCVK